MKRSFSLRLTLACLALVFLVGLIFPALLHLHSFRASRFLLPPQMELAPFRVWILDESGKILASTTKEAVTPNWRTLVTSPGVFRRVSDDFAVEGALPLTGSGWLIARLPVPIYSFGWRTRLEILFRAIPFMITCVGLCVGLALFLTRRKGVMVQKVLSEIKGGNLKARFPLGPLDEFGRLMAQFNDMADEIERLLVSLKRSEGARRKFLEEISHDLRTPVASAKNVLTIVCSQYQSLGEAERQRCLVIAEREIFYIESLLEDLFVLAEVDEPNASTKFEGVDLESMIGLELESFREPGTRLTFKLEAFAETGAIIRGDHRLIMRMVRNALENAARFARTEVRVRIGDDSSGNLEIAFQNDGSAVTEEERSSFGNRRSDRLKAGGLAGKKSLGLGSVIMKRVAELHGGKVELRNRSDAPGVEILFHFPGLVRITGLPDLRRAS